VAHTLLTTAEVAEAFRVTEATVMKWARDGRLPVIKLPGGKGNRYRIEDIERLAQPDEAAS